MLLTLTRLITAALLVGSAIAFAAGAVIEHHAVGGERRVAQRAEASQRGERHAPTQSEHSGEGTSAPAAEPGGETLLGINPESTGPVVVAVAFSLVLATLILTVSSPMLAVGVALAMLAFTVLDIRELTHQLTESRPAPAARVGIIAALHLLAGTSALLTIRDTRLRPGTRSFG